MALEMIGYVGLNFGRTLRMIDEEKGAACEHLPEVPYSGLIKSLHPLG